jgi:hypothetical protein
MKGFKWIVVMAFALSLALAVAGYADELAARVTSEEEIPVWSRSDAKPETTASIGPLARVTSEEEIPVWNREEVPSWHPGWMSQIGR